MAAHKKTCVLCGGAIDKGEAVSMYRVAGDIKGFSRTIDLEKNFHNACVTKPKGVNEIARAQVLDYLEAVEFNRSIIDDLKNQNLDRAKKLMREIEWRDKYEPPKDKE